MPVDLNFQNNSKIKLVIKLSKNLFIKKKNKTKKRKKKISIKQNSLGCKYISRIKINFLPMGITLSVKVATTLDAMFYYKHEQYTLKKKKKERKRKKKKISSRTFDATKEKNYSFGTSTDTWQGRR